MHHDARRSFVAPCRAPWVSKVGSYWLPYSACCLRHPSDSNRRTFRRLAPRRLGQRRSRRRGADTPLTCDRRDGRRVAGRVGLVCLEHRRGLPLDDLGLDENGDDLACGKAEGAVIQSLQQLGDGARVRRDADPGLAVGGEDVVEGRLGADGKRLVCLALVGVPELVSLGEAGLEPVRREHVVDGGLERTSAQGFISRRRP